MIASGLTWRQAASKQRLPTRADDPDDSKIGRKGSWSIACALSLFLVALGTLATILEVGCRILVTNQAAGLNLDAVPTIPARETSWHCWKANGADTSLLHSSGVDGLSILSMDSAREVRGAVCMVKNLCLHHGHLVIMRRPDSALPLQPGHTFAQNLLSVGEEWFRVQDLKHGQEMQYMPGLTVMLLLAQKGLQRHIAHWLEKIAVVSSVRNHVPETQTLPSLIAVLNHPQKTLAMQDFMLDVALGIRGVSQSAKSALEYNCNNAIQQSTDCTWKAVARPRVLYQEDWNQLGLQARELPMSLNTLWRNHNFGSRTPFF